MQYPHERVKYVKEPCRVEESLKDSSLFGLTCSLEIYCLVSWLKYQIELFETDEAKEDRLDNFRKEVDCHSRQVVTCSL